MAADPRSKSELTRDLIILVLTVALLFVIEAYTTGTVNYVLSVVIGGFFLYFAYVQLSYIVNIS